MVTHQRPEGTPILARKPIAQLPEDGTVHLRKHGCRIVGVLIESRPSDKLPVQARQQIHPIHAVIAGQLLDRPLGEAPIFLHGIVVTGRMRPRGPRLRITR